jgi:hypothetical protein
MGTGLRKVHGRFLKFSDAPIPDKNSFIFLWVNAKSKFANSTPAYLTSGQFYAAQD